MFEQVYHIIKMIPEGKVATYGQIAELIVGCTPRVVGFALASLEREKGVPWQRVINAKGETSPRVWGSAHVSQQELLEKEGVQFNRNNRVSLKKYRWQPPEELL